MMYPYMTFNDDTEVTHSQMQDNGTVKVYIETPIEGGFKDLKTILGFLFVKRMTAAGTDTCSCGGR